MSRRDSNSSKRRKSYYSFRKEYPNEFEGQESRKPEKHTVISATLIALGLVLVIVLGYFLASIIFETSNRPIPEEITAFEEITDVV